MKGGPIKLQRSFAAKDAAQDDKKLEEEKRREKIERAVTLVML